MGNALPLGFAAVDSLQGREARPRVLRWSSGRGHNSTCLTAALFQLLPWSGLLAGLTYLAVQHPFLRIDEPTTIGLDIAKSVLRLTASMRTKPNSSTHEIALKQSCLMG